MCVVPLLLTFTFPLLLLCFWLMMGPQGVLWPRIGFHMLNTTSQNFHIHSLAENSYVYPWKYKIKSLIIEISRIYQKKEYSPGLCMSWVLVLDSLLTCWVPWASPFLLHVPHLWSENLRIDKIYFLQSTRNLRSHTWEAGGKTAAETHQEFGQWDMLLDLNKP